MLSVRPLPFTGIISADGSMAERSGGYGISKAGGSAIIRAWSNERQQLALRGAWNTRFIDTDLRFPESNASIPNRLHSLSAGPIFQHRSDSGWSLSFFSSIEAASDRLRADSDQLTYRLGTTALLPAGERDQWFAMLFWDSNSRVMGGAPLPALGYHWRPENDWEVIIGIPIAGLRWQPHQQWRFEATVLGPSLQGNLRWSPNQMTRVTASISRDPWRSSRYWRHQRPDKDEAIRFQEWIAKLEWNQRFHRAPAFTVFAGYAFERFVSESEPSSSFFGRPRNNSLRLDSGVVVGLQLTTVIP
ncbi:MAG: hypothetical protein EA401_02605 [Planctomycetota bacterium]|nr:MAG: hypothetical protein EA401_02605 [Planctomycetota bacterium]